MGMTAGHLLNSSSMEMERAARIQKKVINHKEKRIMKRRVNGMWVDIPTDSSGRVNSDELRQAAAIPSDRAMILHRQSGQNVVVSPHAWVRTEEGDSFSDAPLTIRG